MIKKKLGFTLLEFILVIIVLSIIAVVSSQMLAQGLNGFLTSKNVIEADWQGRLALERMGRDIRAIRSSASITTAASNQLVFTDTNNNSVTYQLSGTNLTRNTQTLADGIQTLTLAYTDSSGATTAVLANIRYIQITLNITKNNSNYTITTALSIRNVFT